jgi:hypothetical protein
MIASNHSKALGLMGDIRLNLCHVTGILQFWVDSKIRAENKRWTITILRPIFLLLPFHHYHLKNQRPPAELGV